MISLSLSFLENKEELYLQMVITHIIFFVDYRETKCGFLETMTGYQQ